MINDAVLDLAPPPGARTGNFGSIRIVEVNAPDSASARPVDAGPAVLLRHMLSAYTADASAPASFSAEPFALRPGLTVIEDLRLAPGLSMSRSYHAIDVVIPWSVFDRVAEQAGVGSIDALEVPRCVGIADKTIEHLIGAMLPRLRERPGGRTAYTHHLALALATHVAHAYGRLRPGERVARGGLAPHVLRRAQEALRANLQTGLSLEALADACGLSRRHFARAFRDTVGSTPHRWMMSARVEAAKTMILRQDASLADVAIACGFADQSHLSRVFKRETGVSPAAWRRDQANRGGGPSGIQASPNASRWHGSDWPMIGAVGPT